MTLGPDTLFGLGELAICVACAYLAFLMVRDAVRSHLQHRADEKWAERYFAAIRADRARRDRLGRWMPKERYGRFFVNETDKL
jgi:hypothetical protein